MNLKDQIRSQIFSDENRKPDNVKIEFFGAQVEVRQPMAGDILDMAGGSKQQNLLTMAIQYCYVPGTEEKVFDDADFDLLKGLKFSKDFSRFMKAVEQLTDIDLKEAEGN